MKKTIAITCSKIGSLEGIDLEGVTIYEGITMSEVGNFAAMLESQGVGAIIATGGTVSEVRKRVSVPVVMAEYTYFDALETLQEIERNLKVFDKKVALILHENSSFNMGRLQPFLKNQISFFSFHNEEHLRKIVRLLFKKDFALLVGGPTVMFLAEQLGMKAHQITCGKESVAVALNRAKEILTLIRKDREEKQRLKTIIDIFQNGIIATDHNGNVNLCNPRALSLLNLSEQDVLSKNVFQIIGDPAWKEVYTQGIKHTDVIIEYNKRKFFSNQQPIIENGRVIGSVGTLQEVSEIQKMEHKYRSAQTLGLIARHRFRDVIGNSDVIREAIEQAKAYAEFDSTVLIEGDTGTGKEIFAQSIHMSTVFSK